MIAPIQTERTAFIISFSSILAWYMYYISLYFYEYDEAVENYYHLKEKKGRGSRKNLLVIKLPKNVSFIYFIIQYLMPKKEP